MTFHLILRSQEDFNEKVPWQLLGKMILLEKGRSGGWVGGGTSV